MTLPPRDATRPVSAPATLGGRRGGGRCDEGGGADSAPVVSGWQRTWTGFKRIAPWALATVVVVLLWRQGRAIDWDEAWRAMRQQQASMLAVAAALTALSFCLVASYDLIGRHESRHGLQFTRTLLIAAICYAFNLNLGSLVGALAMKLRLYRRVGLQLGTAARVIVVTIATNWLGYFVAAGSLLAFAPPPLPASWPLSTVVMRVVGLVMIAAAASYVGLGIVRGRRRITVRGHEMHLPGGGVVLWQLAVSLANWCVMGAIVWTLLEQRVDYAAVLGVLLLAAVAGVITHVPAGLGVIEAVFLYALGDQVPQGPLLAALIAYRAIYYLAPLMLAATGYGIIELMSRRS